MRCMKYSDPSHCRPLLLVLAVLIAVIAIDQDIAAQDDFPVLEGPYLGLVPPGDEPEIFAEGIISAGREHGAPAFSPDGSEVYWCTMRDDEKIEVYFMKIEAGAWSRPAKLCKGFNPFLSADGERLYYIEKGMFGSRNIRFRKRSAAGWSRAKNTGISPSSGKLMWNASIASNGTIYFETMDDRGRYQIYRSKLAGDKYSDPEKLGEEINGQGASSPYIAPDESYLIFGSYRPGGEGGEDLYISYQGPDGNWSRAINLGPGINSSAFEDYPKVSPDGMYLFFLRPGRQLYWVSARFIDELRTEDHD